MRLWLDLPFSAIQGAAHRTLVARARLTVSMCILSSSQPHLRNTFCIRMHLNVLKCHTGRFGPIQDCEMSAKEGFSAENCQLISLANIDQGRRVQTRSRLGRVTRRLSPFAAVRAVLSSITDTYYKTKLLFKDFGEEKAALAAFEARINTSPGIPVSNPTTSFWQENPPFPALVDIRSEALPQVADIVIIGSGITGTSIARTILSECSAMGVKRRVVMLEARQICSGATGRNGGHMKCTAYESFAEYKERFGAERARVLVDFQTSHVPILVDLARREKWDMAEAREVETLDVFYDGDAWTEGQQWVEDFKECMPKEALDTEIWDRKAACEIFKVGKDAYGAISFQAGAMWPYRLVTSALDDLLKKYPSELFIETHTPVDGISTTGNSPQPFIIHTPRGDILTSHVVHATNAHAANLVPGLRGKLIPIRGSMSAQRPGTAFPELDGSRSWCLINKKGYEYVTQRPGNVDSVDSLGGEIMIGGGMMRKSEISFVFSVLEASQAVHCVKSFENLLEKRDVSKNVLLYSTLTKKQTAFEHNTDISTEAGRYGLDDFGVASDAETSYMAGCHLSGVLPMAFGTENWGDDASGGRMKSLWSGSLGITADQMPFVGRLEPSLTGRKLINVARSDEKRSSPCPGEWIAAGYNGEGMVNAWLCGVALGLMVIGREASTLEMPGKPYGKLDDWFPKEYICTHRRVARASVYQLLANR